MKSKQLIDVDVADDAEIRAAVLNLVQTVAGRGPVNVINAEANAKLKQRIMDETRFMDRLEFASLSTRIYAYAHGITCEDQLPHCENCGRLIRKNVVSTHVGFVYRSCSGKCNANRQAWRDAHRTTKLMRYGDANWNNPEKTRRTCMTRYGATSNMSTPEFRDKSRQTKLERYGDPDFTNTGKCLETKRDRYAEGELGRRISDGKHRMAAEDPEYWNRQISARRHTLLERYGDENWNNSEQARMTTAANARDDPDYWDRRRRKAAETCVEKYGVDNYSKTGEYRDRTRRTCLERYGVEFYAQTDEQKRRAARTCMERYGVDNYSKTEIARRNLSERINRATYEKIRSCPNVRPEFGYDEYVAMKGFDVRWTCLECGLVFDSPVNFPYGQKTGDYVRCPVCHPPAGGRSGSEKELQDFLSGLGHDVRRNVRDVIPPLELDAYVPERRFAVEFDGLFWHSSLQNGDMRHLMKKTNACSRENILLCHVFEDEWECRRDAVQAILRRQAGPLREIPRGDVGFAELSRVQAVEFLSANSPDMFVKPGARTLGLTIGGELASVMSFSVNKGRRCVITAACDSTVSCFSNCFETLLRRVEAEIKPEQVSYKVDMRYPFVSGLERTGLKLVCITDPRRWLLSPAMRRLGRLHGRNDAEKLAGLKLDGDRPTLEQLHELGYAAIYDCGAMIFERPPL